MACLSCATMLRTSLGRKPSRFRLGDDDLRDLGNVLFWRFWTSLKHTKTSIWRRNIPRRNIPTPDNLLLFNPPGNSMAISWHFHHSQGKMFGFRDDDSRKTKDPIFKLDLKIYVNYPCMSHTSTFYGILLDDGKNEKNTKISWKTLGFQGVIGPY